jgi:hypothetical protein
VIITRRVYRTNDGRFVGESDPDAAFLAYPAGTEISDRLAEQYGLTSWVRSGHVVRTPSVVIATDPSGTPTMASVGAPLTPVGTVPPGHATASIPGVPAEVAPPVVNADGTHRGEAVRQPPTRTTTAPAKPTRTTTREV